MRQLRLPSASDVTWFVALCRHTSGRFPTFLSSARGNHRSDARVFVQPVSPSVLPVLLRPEGALVSPKSPANPSCIRPGLRPRLSLCARLLTALRCCPRTLRRRRPQLFITYATRSRPSSGVRGSEKPCFPSTPTYRVHPRWRLIGFPLESRSLHDALWQKARQRDRLSEIEWYVAHSRRGRTGYLATDPGLR
jgi:hypothetical protein